MFNKILLISSLFLINLSASESSVQSSKLAKLSESELVTLRKAMSRNRSETPQGTNQGVGSSIEQQSLQIDKSEQTDSRLELGSIEEEQISKLKNRIRENNKTLKEIVSMETWPNIKGVPRKQFENEFCEFKTQLHQRLMNENDDLRNGILKLYGIEIELV